MNTIIRLAAFSLLFGFLFCSTGLNAAEHSLSTGDGAVESSSQVDWQKGTFILTVSYRSDQAGIPLPGQRSKAEAAFRRHLPALFVEEISKVKIDSRRSIAKAIVESPTLAAEFQKLSATGKIVSSYFTDNFSEFRRIYHYDIYPQIASVFITHTRSSSQTEELTYVAGGRYSGIVIYVNDPLEIFGTHTKGSLEPAIFPRVYNENTDLLIDMRMLDPEALRATGMLRYYHTSQLDAIQSRVGEVPMYVHATALFGVHSSDLIVSRRAALKIKASRHTLSLIKEGKIAIVSETRLR
ncbi:MAG: hypothetical protein U5P10_10385 [Spirochaetia bacterium]|nr:hypothetical protein [Spirochaetia bacterium]